MLNSRSHTYGRPYNKPTQADSNIPRVLSNVQQDEPPVEPSFDSTYSDKGSGRPYDNYPAKSAYSARAAPNLSWTGGRSSSGSPRPYVPIKSSGPYNAVLARQKAEQRDKELRWQFLYDLKGAYGASRQSWIEWTGIIEQLQKDQRLFQDFYNRLHRNSNGLRWRSNCNHHCANNLLNSLIVKDPLDPSVL